MLETGVPNLDRVLGGGLPAGDVLLVVGPAGSGKTTLGMQMGFHTAGAGRKVLYISTMSEPSEKLVGHIRDFDFYDEDLLGKELLLNNIYPLVRESLSRISEAIVESAREEGAKLLILDGLMPLRDLHRGSAEFRFFVHELGSALFVAECSAIITSSQPGGTGGHLPEFTMADGVVLLGGEEIGSQAVRTLRATKMRGQRPLLGRHAMRIDESGIRVFPRIESTPPDEDPGLSVERVPTGLPELDRMMSGGPPAGGVTILAGAQATGKTLACLGFVLEGVERDETSLFVTFRETPRQLVDRAASFGIDLAKPLRDGRIEILHRRPVDLVVDEVTREILDRVEALEPDRLVLESIGDLDHALDGARRRGYMCALAAWLRAREVTSLITLETPQTAGPELDFSGTPIAVFAENLVLFRFVEYEGNLYRILSVLKMKDSPYDPSIRQYEITGEGLRMLEVDESPDRLLKGIARMPSESRVKRGPETGEGEGAGVRDRPGDRA